jgi:hypothetical protein
MIQSLTIRVSQLQQEKRNLEGLLITSEKNLTDLAKSMKIDWVESLLETANNETRDLKEKLYALMVQKSSLDDNYYRIEKDLAKSRLDKVKLKILLGRIIDENNIDILKSNYKDIDIEPELMENLKHENFENIECSPDIKQEDESIIDSGMLNESTIILLGGHDRLAKFLPQSLVSDILKGEKHEEKENELKPLMKHEPMPQSGVSLSKIPLKESQETECKMGGIRAVKFSELVEAKSIDRSYEQLEQSKEARKKHGVIVKRIVIPSKQPRNTQI